MRAFSKRDSSPCRSLRRLPRWLKVNSSAEAMANSHWLCDASKKYALANRLSLAIIAVGLFLGSSVLCTTGMEPKFLGVPLLGVFGFIGAFVLSVYVIVRVLQDRHEMANNKKLK